MDSMLEGLRVVEASDCAAVAHGGQQLAAWGAEVIRIEPIGSAGPRIEPSLRRGKRSVAIDLRQPRGQALLAQLITAPGAQAGAWCTDWVTDRVTGRVTDRSSDRMTGRMTGRTTDGALHPESLRRQIGRLHDAGLVAGPPSPHTLRHRSSLR